MHSQQFQKTTTLHTKVRGRNRIGAQGKGQRNLSLSSFTGRPSLEVKKSAKCQVKLFRVNHLTNVRSRAYNYHRARTTHSKKGNKVRYEFQIIKTVEIDSKNLKLVSSEEEALEMLKNGWGIEIGEQEIRLVHVGHGMDK